jgi:hypothetical protein
MIEALIKSTGGLRKGQYITPEMLEKLFDLERTSPAYQFKLMALEKDIKKLLEENGVFASIKSEKYGIRILNDTEASLYNMNKIGRHLKGIEDSHTDLMNVDVNHLTKDEGHIHHQRVALSCRIVDSVKQGITKDMPIKLEAYKSFMPKLFKE